MIVNIVSSCTAQMLPSGILINNYNNLALIPIELLVCKCDVVSKNTVLTA